MVRLARVACFLILLGFSAIAAQAAITPVDPSSVLGDPTIIFKGDPPGCTPPFCYNLSYTDAPNIVFFNVTPPLPVPPTYNCVTTGGLNCSVDVFGGEFITVGLQGDNNENFSLSITGGPVTLTIPSSGISCIGGDCTPGESITLDPIPEPRTALLYLTGLVFLGWLIRKRLVANSIFKRVGSLETA